MTQEERWNIRYLEVQKFMETNKRSPSKFIYEERDLRNWWKPLIAGTRL